MCTSETMKGKTSPFSSPKNHKHQSLRTHKIFFSQLITAADVLTFYRIRSHTHTVFFFNPILCLCTDSLSCFKPDWLLSYWSLMEEKSVSNMLDKHWQRVYSQSVACSLHLGTGGLSHWSHFYTRGWTGKDRCKFCRANTSVTDKQQDVSVFS